MIFTANRTVSKTPFKENVVNVDFTKTTAHKEEREKYQDEVLDVIGDYLIPSAEKIFLTYEENTGEAAVFIDSCFNPFPHFEFDEFNGEVYEAFIEMDEPSPCQIDFAKYLITTKEDESEADESIDVMVMIVSVIENTKDIQKVARIGLFHHIEEVDNVVKAYPRVKLSILKDYQDDTLRPSFEMFVDLRTEKDLELIDEYFFNIIKFMAKQ